MARTARHRDAGRGRGRILCSPSALEFALAPDAHRSVVEGGGSVKVGHDHGGHVGVCVLGRDLQRGASSLLVELLQHGHKSCARSGEGGERTNLAASSSGAHFQTCAVPISHGAGPGRQGRSRGGGGGLRSASGLVCGPSWSFAWMVPRASHKTIARGRREIFMRAICVVCLGPRSHRYRLSLALGAFLAGWWWLIGLRHRAISEISRARFLTTASRLARISFDWLL